MPVFKVLDVFLYKGNSFTSKFIRFLMSVRYGIPFRDAYSHIALGYDDKSTISAEAKGTMIVPNSDIEEGKSDVVIYRYKNISEDQIKTFLSMAPEYIGRGYAYARYIIDAAKIFSFVIFVLALFFGWMNLKMLFVFIGILAFLQLISWVLSKLDKKTSDCSELVAIFLDALYLMPYFSSLPRNEFPNSQLTKMEMMRWHGLAEVVGYWSYKDKEWKEVGNDRANVGNIPFDGVL